MADVVDIGNDRTEQIIADSEKSIRSRVPEPKIELTPEDLECEQCGNEIEHKRAMLGHSICIACARENERYEKQFSRHRSRYYDSED